MGMKTSIDSNLFAAARAVLAGGVNSPVRAFKAVGRPPVFMARGAGKYLYGEDGRRYLDFCLSWGPLVLGHAHPAVVTAATAALKRGASFGACTRGEIELATLVCTAFPSVERVRFVNSGTEAVMTAIRLARGFTGRPMILKFDGCYHGHSDALLVSAGSGASGLPAASSGGVPDGVVRDTLSIPFNDEVAIRKAVRAHAKKLAAIIVEPVPANMGVVLPRPGYLDLLRELATRHGIVLIFDEVITGFRLCHGGAQKVFGVTPDLTVLGKVIGGGFPVGAVGGHGDIMALLAPDGPVYQAGTLSGNPVAMAAGAATLRWLAGHPSAYDQMSALVASFADAWRAQSPLTVNHVGSMFTIFLTKHPVGSYADARQQDAKLFARWYRRSLDQGIYLPPALMETAFVSVLHTKEDVTELLKSTT